MKTERRWQATENGETASTTGVGVVRAAGRALMASVGANRRPPPGRGTPVLAAETRRSMSTWAVPSVVWAVRAVVVVRRGWHGDGGT